MLLNNQQIIEEITKEIRKEIKISIEMNENEDMRTPNLWDSAKVVLKGRVIGIQAYLKEKRKIKYIT